MRHAATIVPALVLALSAFVFSPCARAADELNESDKALVAQAMPTKAIEFASHWFSLVAAGDYAAAYAATTSDFQKDNPLEKWIESEREFATKAGKLLGQAPMSSGMSELNPKGAPPGAYFTVYFSAKFENSDRCCEGIRIRLENDGGLHVSAYQRTYAGKGAVQTLRELQQEYTGARFPTERITKEEMDGYYAEISMLANWHGFAKDNTYVIRDEEGDASYIFTVPGHPAHPAVIKLRQMVVQGISGVGKTGHFAGDEAAYRSWLASVAPERATARPILVLVDAIPSDAVIFYRQIDVKLPPEKIKDMSDVEIEQGLAELMSSTLMPFAKEHDTQFICLLAAKGEDARGFAIPGSEAKLMLSMKNPAFVAVFYKGGRIETSPVAFSTGKPGSGRSVISMSLKNMAAPSDTPLSLWVYFNLARIQSAAAKAGSSEVFLATSGTGKTVPVTIPGMKEPLQVFENDSELKASWYADPDKPNTWQ